MPDPHCGLECEVSASGLVPLSTPRPSSDASDGTPRNDVARASPYEANRMGGISRKFRFLAYGDSLTAGLHSRRKFAPYGENLLEALSQNRPVEVRTCGVSGFTAVQMARRLRARAIRDCVGEVGQGLLHLLLNEGPFDIAIIMAGTNDLSTKTSASSITTAVAALHSACHELRIPTVALTVPPNRLTARVAMDGTSEMLKYKERWTQVNGLLHKWVARHGSADGVLRIVDVSKFVPFSETNGWWDPDGLHLSPEGSKRLGESLAPVIDQLMSSLHLSDTECEKNWLQVTRSEITMPDCCDPYRKWTVRAGLVPAPSISERSFLRLLAYGDSLTAGYHSYGHLFSPYAEGFADALLQSDVYCHIWVCGLSGWTAAGMVEARNARALKDHVDRTGMGVRAILEDKGPFDAVLVMAGTNDLAHCPEPVELLNSIKALHQVCHDFGVPTIAFTIPPSKASTRKNSQIEIIRKEVNEHLRSWAEESCKSSPIGRVCCFVDSDQLLPFELSSGNWEDDGLHFTRAGSWEFGSQLAGVLRLVLDNMACSKIDSPFGDT